MNYLEIRKFLFERTKINHEMEFSNFSDPYRKLKTYFNLELSSFFLYILNKTNIHPNSITYFGIFWVYLGSFCFFLKSDLATFFGLFIYFTKLIPDYIDGALAFIKNKQTKRGHLLDVLAGNFNRLGVVIGTLIYIYYSTYNLLILFLLFSILFFFFTDPRLYKTAKSTIIYDNFTKSHKERNLNKKEHLIKKILRYFNYDGRSSYSDFIILLIFLDFSYGFSLILEFLPVLWTGLYFLSYLQGWIKFYEKN